MKDKKTFGSFIKEKRISKNYSQKELAELLYVTESAVSKWERGVSYPDIALITDLCKVLEVSEKELIESGDDDEYRKIKSNSDKYTRLKKTLFWTFNIAYSLAVLICFIVNLSVNHTLSWFFIVLASIIVAYSFCPTFTWVYRKYKILIFIGSTIFSLFLLFLVCSIYSQNYWFMIPTLGVLLGYFIIFFPILFNRQKDYLSLEKYTDLKKWFMLSYSLGILLLIALLLIFIYFYHPFNLGLGLLILGVCMLLPIIFGLIFSLNLNKKVFKILIYSLVGLLSIGIIFGLANALYLKSQERNNEYLIEGNFSEVKVDVTTSNISIYITDSESKAICLENKNLYFDVKIIGDSLNIIQVDNRKFYEKIFDFSSLKVDLYLSKAELESLNIECSTGDVKIKNGFTINDVEINCSTGDIAFASNVNNNLFISTSTGDVCLSNARCNNLEINTSTGDTKLVDTLVQEDFNMNGATGNLVFDGFDAKNIYVQLSTGDVKGTILTSKFFIAKSDTGDVRVPNTREGGECIITVDTGSINITYKD